MSRIFTFTLVALAVLALVTGAAAAQDATNETANATAENDAINTTGNTLETGPTFEEPIDSDVTLAEWSYDLESERFTLVLDVSSRTQVGITEVVSVDSPQATDMNVYQDRLGSGRHEIEFAAAPGASGEAAIVISTPESMRRGSATVVSTGYIPQSLPFEQTGSTAGWIGGAVTAIGMVAAAAYRTKNKSHKPVVVCE